MKQGTWSILTIAALCMVLFATACAATNATTIINTQAKTITTSGQPNTTTIISTVTSTLPSPMAIIPYAQTVTADITTTTAPAFGPGLPPLIPHPLDVVMGSYGTCFQCHPMLTAGHQGSNSNERTCIECHLPGPIDPNLV